MDSEEDGRIMEIRKMLHCNYNISQTNQAFMFSVMENETMAYVINVRMAMEYRDDCIYVNDEYLSEQKRLIDSSFDLADGKEYYYHLILGNREFMVNDCTIYNHYMNNIYNIEMRYSEFVIQRLVE